MPDAATIVPLLFEAAGLSVPDDELSDFVAVYPQVRAGMDTLYDVPDLACVDPTLTFAPEQGGAG